MQPASSRLRALPLQVYGFRVLGMGLGALPVGVVLAGFGASWPYWAWTVLCCLLWPHLAYLHTRLRHDALRAERHNLVADSLIAGSMVTVMHFNLLPSVLLLTVATADKINTGIRGLWLRALPAMGLGLAGAGLITGFVWQPETRMPELLASLPILVIHTLAVSLAGYRLVRRVQKQNLHLDELSRLDTLTRLESRAYWLAQAETALRSHPAQPVTLALLDVDRFKDINDRHGHAAGDDVLRAIAEVIRSHLPAGAHAGRLGGDEMAVLLPLAPDPARDVAARICADVESLTFPQFIGLRCSVSIGLAGPPRPDATLRSWSEAADRAMYSAKRAGRGEAS